MDRKWMSANRMSKEYEDGVKEFVEFVVEHADDHNNIKCPCLKCCFSEISVDELQDHLVCNGIDQSYTCWTMHGETKAKSTNVNSSVRYSEKDFETNTYDCDRVEEIATAMEEDLQDFPKMFETLEAIQRRRCMRAVLNIQDCLHY